VGSLNERIAKDGSANAKHFGAAELAASSRGVSVPTVFLKGNTPIEHLEQARSVRHIPARGTDLVHVTSDSCSKAREPAGATVGKVVVEKGFKVSGSRYVHVMCSNLLWKRSWRPAVSSLMSRHQPDHGAALL
jgi:hypothetical protein